MKFLDRLHASKRRPQEPRLSGQTEPIFSKGAMNNFAQVLNADTPLELRDAVNFASLHCNRELLARMHDYRDAVIELSEGAGSKEDVNTAREHFILGCRLALDTND